jgi:protein phosphatase
MQLLRLNPEGKVIFVGDTHGDLDSSKKIIEEYLKRKNKIVFLGDYVDRGPKSRENINFLLDKRKENPQRIYLLQGNHEGRKWCHGFYSIFWERLNELEKDTYQNIFERMPIAASIGPIIATHAALPEIQNLSEINQIVNGDNRWWNTVWGDFFERGFYEKLGRERPYFLAEDFKRIMGRLNKKVLIRGHDPHAPESLFDGKCVTIFSSKAYERDRTIAIANFNNRKIQSIDDLAIEKF